MEGEKDIKMNHDVRQHCSGSCFKTWVQWDHIKAWEYSYDPKETRKDIANSSGSLCCKDEEKYHFESFIPKQQTCLNLEMANMAWNWGGLLWINLVKKQLYIWCRKLLKVWRMAKWVSGTLLILVCFSTMSLAVEGKKKKKKKTTTKKANPHNLAPSS